MADNKKKKHFKNTDNENTMLIQNVPVQNSERARKTGRPIPPQPAQQYRNAQQQVQPLPQGQQYYQNPQQQGQPIPQGQQYYQNPQQQGQPIPQGQQYYQNPQQQGQPLPQGQQYYQNPRQQGQPIPQGQQYYQNPQQAQYYRQPPTQGQPRPAKYYANAPQGHPYQQPYNMNAPQGHPYNGSQQPPVPPRKPAQTMKNGKPPKQPKQKKKKSFVWKLLRRLILILLILALFIFGIYSCTSLSLIKKMNHVSDGERNRTAGAISKKYVTSVLIIGTDGRTASDRGRSDSMILVSLNSKTNELTMTSFLRDSYVDIPGRGKDKLNAAYAYGGPELLMDTIESNFNVRIDDYISVNFNTFASIIDAAGGVTINVSDEEAEALNIIMISEVNELMGDGREDDLLSSGGKLHLNGKQALSYARIRSVGRWDLERTSRQRRVMTELIKNAGKNGVSFLRGMTKSALPNITTNMSRKELYILSLKAPFALSYKTKQLQIPADGTYTSLTGTASGDVLEFDSAQNISLIEREVFRDK